MTQETTRQERRNGNGHAPSFLDRTLDQLRAAWEEVAESARHAVTGAPRPELSDDDSERLKERIHSCIDAVGGEVSARALAAEIGGTYLQLNETGRERFLRLLATDFGVERAAVDAAVARLGDAPDLDGRRIEEAALRHALQAPRIVLLSQFNGLLEGVKFLVDMRAELLRLRRKDPLFTPLEGDLKELLAYWFDIGFLELRRITWDSPASLLEKLASYEAVHAIESWQDLKKRLESDRRLYAFFHPHMPEEPLIFVEVALVDGMADSVQELLDLDGEKIDPRSADTAIFYSISNAQAGLAGISFGGFLIKRVADDLSAELKNLKTFATLSPIPGFRRWLAEQGKGNDALLRREDRKALATLAPPVDGVAALPALLDRADWHMDESLNEALRGPLGHLCAHYLLEVRRENGRARDPVANFHLTNGARVERLNWMADISAKGLRDSAGLMVNYRYRLNEIEENHDAYRKRGRIAASPAVRALGKG
ncbi:MAG: malonyl-CoA decarboxylase [Proteobacteria bacterium]|nr:malonyl-CoA decarboxylase [Pseudomonadota bacterium]